MLKRILALTLVMLMIATGAVMAQDDMMTPSVTVADQVVTNGQIVVGPVVSDGPGWMVIHADNGEGGIGPVIGFAAVADGETETVSVSVDPAQVTSTVYAMLHTDTGEEGVYEFGEVEGADGPVVVDGAPIAPPLTVELIDVHPQSIADGTVTVQTVVISVDGWLVIHADSGEGSPGPVVGFAPVSAGNNSNITVDLDGMETRMLFPMLHVDTGEVGTYEFGQVEGADGPVRAGERVAVTGVTTGPQMIVPDQTVTDSVTAPLVVSDGPGWLVIHAASEEGSPGPVIGYAAVSEGVNTDVVVEIDAEGLTRVVFPMLHVDTGEEGVYEFGEVEGADGPVRVGENVLVFPIDAGPSIVYNGTLNENVLTVEEAFIDVPGWLVIHADNGEGSPGPVIGWTALDAGTTFNVEVELDADGITETVFPMLHADTGEAGVYEFGDVEGADGPVQAFGAVVTGPLTPTVE